METIPLRPLYENEKFILASGAVRQAITDTLYHLCIRKMLKDYSYQEFSRLIREYSNVTDKTFYQDRQIMTSILQEVIPIILNMKRVSNRRAEKAGKTMIKKAAEKRSLMFKDNVLSEKQDSHMEIIPILSPKENHNYHQGRHDHVERKQAIEHNATGNKTLLTDN